MSKILSEIKYSMKMFLRNRSAMFFTLGFPIVLFLAIGFMVGSQTGPMMLYYADNDHSQTSMAFIQGINGTGVVKLIDGTGMDLAGMLKDGKIPSYVVIPQGFESTIARGTEKAGINVYYDRSQATSPMVMTIVQQVADGFNIRLSGINEKIAVASTDVATTSMSVLDFMVPGIIGIAIMMSAINLTVGVNAKNKARGIFRKLATTPISRIEWNISKIVTQTIITLVCVALSVLIAIFAFNIHLNIDAIAVLIVIFGTLTFVGLGMIMAVFLKNEDTAASAASILTFPFMFLSGTFFPVENMPSFLQLFGDISPLTYVNSGLRNAMISGNYGAALTDLGIVAVIGIVLFAIGVFLMKWKEE